jgi:hypothetical protein
MRVLGTAVIVLLVVCWTALRAWGRSRQKRDQRDELGPGALVLVRTPDRKTLVATVRSRGPSHFWIELPPGDTRFWVPATAVEPAPERAVLRSELFRSTLERAPRQMLDSEI